MTPARTSCVALLFAALAARDAVAQTPSAPPGRIEVSVGGLWIGSASIGAADAAETTASNGKLRIFSTSSELAAAPSFDGRVGVRLTRALAVEMEAAYGRPELRVAISGDIENAAPTTAVERIQQYLIGGGVVWHVPGAARWRRLAPFVEGGGGYLRQLHDQALLAQTGRYFQVGGGVTYLLASRPGRLKASGIRLDARAVVRRDGVAFAAGAHTAPAVGGSFFVRF